MQLSRTDISRRVLDIVISLFGIFLLIPFLTAVAIWIKVDSPGPLFHRAVRIGRGNNKFCLFKFRTMIVGAARIGPCITKANDDRVTRSGHFLRKTKIDELPQLYNVLIGDMSLVGPRPEDPQYVELYTKEQQAILNVRPGITSAASLAYRNEVAFLKGPNWDEIYCHEIMPSKLAIDLDYLANRTLVSDLWLIIRTTSTMFR